MRNRAISASPTCNSKLSLHSRFVTRVRFIQAQKIGGSSPTVNPVIARTSFKLMFVGMKDDKIAHRRSPVCAAIETNLPVRILVVEDDLAIRQLSAEALTSSGYQVETAEDGAAGWEALQGSNYDLLITDNNMPRMSGVELVKMLRSARITLPVVMVSGSIPLEALNRDSSLQLAATLLKPFTMDELLGTVEKVVRATEEAPGHTVSLAAMAGAT